MRTFGMWLLAGLFLLAGWDAFERLDRRAESTSTEATATPQESDATALEDGTPPPPNRY
jgi:hypothetical protein